MVERFMAPGPWITRDLKPCVLASDYDALARDLAACKIARDGWMKASDEAHARIRELEAAIVKFWDYAKLVLPMPVHPAVGAIMRIGRDLESRGDKQ